ncbi:MAG: hypothetical protein H7336_08085 [Bacteriovorax sp.]|nr:hypothetical protein [Bacteriovorax sp.]
MKILLLILIALPALSFSAEFASMASKPNVLELKKYRTVTGGLELRYIHDSPRIVMRIGAGTNEANDFLEKVMKSDLIKLNCDGDFYPAYDRFGSPYMHINSLKSCVDEDGSVIAHSIGLTALSNADVAKSKKFIEDNMKPVAALVAPNVNDSHNPKEVVNPKAGVFSSKLDSKNLAK